MDRVLSRLADDDPARVAAALADEPGGVVAYRARIKEKLNLSSGTELIRLAVQWVLENS